MEAEGAVGSNEILKVEPTGFTDGADLGWERKRGVQVGPDVWDSAPGSQSPWKPVEASRSIWKPEPQKKMVQQEAGRKSSGETWLLFAASNYKKAHTTCKERAVERKLRIQLISQIA